MTSPVGPVTETVALADFCAAPPPKISDEPSALARVICAWIPLATEPFMTPSSDNATQMTESVPEASEPLLDEATSVGVGVRPSGIEVLPPRISDSSPIIVACNPRRPAWARTSSKPMPAYSASKSTLVSRPIPL